MIRVENLSKSYGGTEALRQVSFRVAAGEVVGLLGPNGAGKTTLMKILTGYLHPSGGLARIDGLDVQAEPAAVQERIGYLPENAPLYPELTVQSSLQMIADLRRIPSPLQRARLSEAIRAAGLEERLTSPISKLSKGYRQRVGLAQAILHRPPVLILDEPTNGLDPTQIAEVRHLIRSLARRSTVLLSTHILSEVEATCDRAIILMGGEVKADAKLAELAATSNALVSLAQGVDEQEVVGVLAGLDGVASVEIAGRPAGGVTCRVHGSTDRNLCPEVYQAVRRRDWPLTELRQEVRTLEAVFHALCQRPPAEVPLPSACSRE